MDGNINTPADVRAYLRSRRPSPRAELGGADVLVNNAGVMLLGPFGTENPPRPTAEAG